MSKGECMDTSCCMVLQGKLKEGKRWSRSDEDLARKTDN
jgi:hypothetical protein